jgi:preprotein translocase subunit YajC
MTAAYLITGKTYPLRRELRAAGCLFDRNEMGYIVAASGADKALSIAKANGLEIADYTATAEQLTPATGERLRAIRQDKQGRRRQRLIARAEAAERRAEKHRNRVSPHERDFLSLMEPIKIGHHSEGRHRRLVEKAQKAFFAEGAELANADNLRRRADGLLMARVAGDAEAERQAARDAASATISLGDTVSSVLYGTGVVTRVNKKTFGITFDRRGVVMTIDKSHVTLVSKGTGPAKIEHKFKAGDLVTATQLMAKYEGVVKRRTSSGYSVQYTAFGKTRTQTFAEYQLSRRDVSGS